METLKYPEFDNYFKKIVQFLYEILLNKEEELIKMEGTVKWFNSKKGYGFIAGDDGEEYFVHFTAVPRGTFLRENDRVSFEPGESERGKQAKNVKLLQKGSERTDLPKEEESYEENQDSEDFGDEEGY